MHSLGRAIEAARDGGLDFYLIVGGPPELRIRMGLPPSVAEEYPLLLAFQAAYHAYSQPEALEDGLACVLSFDTLYECRIPYSAIKRLIIQNFEEERWPEAWGGNEETAPTEPLPPPPDNVRPFRPRTSRKPRTTEDSEESE